MQIVCAPDSFKESMTAATAADAMRRGILRVLPDAAIDLLPMADGGEGTCPTMVAALGGELRSAAVHDAIGRPVSAEFGLVPDSGLAVVEVAAACGLELLGPTERDPLATTTFGVGELVIAALDAGARHLVVGLGGTATNDAGTGMLTALGARFTDAGGTPLPPGGAALARLAHVDLSGLDPRLAHCRIEVACDVDNPLLGPRGASAVFGPQKGAGPDDVRLLDEALGVWADVVEAAIRRSDRTGGGSRAETVHHVEDSIEPDLRGTSGPQATRPADADGDGDESDHAGGGAPAGTFDHVGHSIEPDLGGTSGPHATRPAGASACPRDRAVSRIGNATDADGRVRDRPGAGAAGGLGAAFLAATPATLIPGVELVMAVSGFAGRVRGADYVFTGEGSADAQSSAGKVPWGVAVAAAALGVPTIVFAGRVDPALAERPDGPVLAYVPITPDGTDPAVALADGPANLEAAVASTVRRLIANPTGRAQPNPPRSED